MKSHTHQTTLFRILGIVLMLFLGIQCVNAQPKKEAEKNKALDIKIVSLKAHAVKTPTFKDSEKTSSYYWERITLRFNLKHTGNETDWLDELTIIWKVYLKDDFNEKEILLSRSITYTDIDRGDSHYACVYLEPDFLRKHLKTKQPDGAQFSLAVEIRVNGIPVATEEKIAMRHRSTISSTWAKGKANRAWSDMYLLPRAYTPFAPLDYDYYEKEKIVQPPTQE